VPRNSNVIVVSLKHRDPEVAQLALKQLIDRYLEHHNEIHRGSGSYDFLRRETDLLRGRLLQTETELQRLKQEARIISLEDTKTDLNTRLNRIQQSILDEQRQLAGHRARLEAIENWSGSSASGASSTTNHSTGTDTNAVQQIAPPDPDVLARYRSVTARSNALQEEEYGLLSMYTTDNPLVKSKRRQLDEALAEKRQLEVDHPSLVATLPAVVGSTGVPRDPNADPLTLRALIAAGEARIATLTAQLESARLDAAEIDKREQAIVELQRRKELEENRFKYFSEELEKWRFDAQLDPKNAPNISKVQEPSLALSASRDLLKKLVMIVFGGVGFGLGLAFLIDFVLDTSVKRPAEIEAKFHIPLMMSIPVLGGMRRRVKRVGARRRGMLQWKKSGGRSQESGVRGQSSAIVPGSPIPNPQSPIPPPNFHAKPRKTRTGPRIISALFTPSENTETLESSSSVPSSCALRATEDKPLSAIPSPLSDQRPLSAIRYPTDEGPSALRPFTDALRDRLILHFQLKNMTHKPKLVAVTGCDSGSGVTTIAWGLAAALSETGDGKVLLVDMNIVDTQVHPFYRGESVPLLTDLINPATPNTGGVAENFYVASATGTNGHSTKLIPKKFYELMPRLKASDFYYIIFDMPPVTQTSTTVTLAGFMDHVLLVIEANRTRRELIQRTHKVLTNAQATVSGVLNKHRSTVPGWVQQDA